MKFALPAFLAVLASSLSAETILYKAAEIHAVAGPVISPGQMLVKDDRIVSVGKKLKVPKGGKVIDLGDLSLYPALIAAPTSLGLTEINAVRATRDDREVGDYTTDVEAWEAVNPASELIPVARANGVAHALVIPMGGRVSGVSGLVTSRTINPSGWAIRKTKSPAAAIPRGNPSAKYSPTRATSSTTRTTSNPTEMSATNA